MRPAVSTSKSNRNAFQPPARLLLLALLFFLSGTAGLIYEIVWERLLELYFGVTMTAITLIVASYMCGLGLGSLLGGRIAQTLKRPILIYGLIEAGIGIFGFFSSAIINWIGQHTAGVHYSLIFLLSFLFLLIPTLLMGMTLPLLTQSSVDRVETSGQVIGLLYGINTLGAASGSLIAGYILIGRFGFDGTTYIAALFNLGVALIAIVSARMEIGGSLAAALVFLLLWTGLSSGWHPWLGDFFEMQRPSLPFIKVGGTFLFSKRLALSSLINYFFPIFLMVFPASFILGGGLPTRTRNSILFLPTLSAGTPQDTTISTRSK